MEKMFYELSTRVAVLETKLNMLIKVNWVVAVTVIGSVTSRVIKFIMDKRNGKNGK